MYEPRLQVTIDTYVTEGAVNKNYGANAALKLDNTSASRKRVYLSFVLPSSFRGKLTQLAKLKLYLKGAWPGTNHVTFKRVTGSWREDQITWANQPSVTNTNSVAVTVTDGEDGDLLEADIEAMLQDVANGEKWYGLQLTIDTDGIKQVHSSEDTLHSERPYCELEYSTAPDAAVDLRPNGQDVYTDVPLLTWTFVTRTPGRNQLKSQVQETLAADVDFASPTYDSGQVDNLREQWDSEAEGITPLTNDEEVLWRVRVYDGNAWSEWSDPATMTYRSTATIDITSPAIDGDDVFDDTPTIVFTVADRDMSAYLIQLFHLEGAAWVELTDVSIGTAYWHEATDPANGSFTIPSGLITNIDSNNQYKVRVTVRDTLDRPKGNEPYSERTFMYVFNPAVTKPDALTVVTAEPVAVLSWHRTAEPDWWIIDLDGIHWQTIAGDTPAFDSGTNIYTYRFKLFTPGEEHEVSIRAKEDDNGVSQLDGPHAFTTAPKHIWFIYEDTEIELLGNDDIPETRVQAGGIQYPLNREDPVGLVGKPQGYNGTLTGMLVTDEDTTAAEKLQLMQDIIDTYGISGKIILIWGENAYYVLVRDFGKSHSTVTSRMIGVTFGWWRTGALQPS